LAALLMSMGIVEKRPEFVASTAPRMTVLLEVARNRQLLCTSLLGILLQFIVFATTFGFTPLAAVQLHASEFQLGLLGVVGTLPGLFVAPLAGTVLPRKFGVKGTLIGGFVLCGLSAVLIPFCSVLWQLFIAQFIGSTGGVVVLTLLMGLCIADVSSERRATAMGVFQAVYGIGMFLGPFTMGWISHSFGFTAAFVFTGFVGLLGVVGLLFNIISEPAREG